MNAAIANADISDCSVAVRVAGVGTGESDEVEALQHVKPGAFLALSPWLLALLRARVENGESGGEVGDVGDDDEDLARDRQGMERRSLSSVAG